MDCFVDDARDATNAGGYGWARSIVPDGTEIVRRLTALKEEISEGTRAYSPFE